jgi:hypothetical protein
MKTNIKEVEFKSLSQAGSIFAQNDDKKLIPARYVLECIPTYLEKDGISSEQRAELTQGFQIHYYSFNPAAKYCVVDGNYLPADSCPTGIETVLVGAELAMNYSTHEFGKLGDTHSPQYKALIKGYRDAVSRYIANKRIALTAAIRALVPAAERQRGQTAEFADRVKSVLDDLKAKCKTANTRGDLTADLIKFEIAHKRMMEWNK